MPPVDQHLRAVARSSPHTPFWILEKDYALGYLLAPELQAVARDEWERQLLPFVPHQLSADQVLDELTDLLAAMPLVPGESEEPSDGQD
jgi:hypothetical protein